MKRFVKYAAFAAVVIAVFLVSFTAAKYISQGSGDDNAVVADWSFEVNETDIATSSNFTFDVFEAILDSDGTEETDVADGKITSGTSGNVEIVINNTSEVTAEYIVTLAGITNVTYSAPDDDDDTDGDSDDDEYGESGGITLSDGEVYVGSFVNYYSFTVDDLPDLPVEFSTDGVNYTSDLSELSFTGTLEAGESATNVTLYWRWPFEGDDDVDTQLGVLAAQGYEIELVVTASVAAWQVD